MNSASLGQFGTMSLMYMDSPGSKVGKVLAMETVVVRSIPELSKFGQFGTWVFLYISHHVIVKPRKICAQIGTEEQKKVERKIPTIMTNFLASFMFINLYEMIIML